jgi:hypothetical protein
MVADDLAGWIRSRPEYDGELALALSIVRRYTPWEGATRQQMLAEQYVQEWATSTLRRGV